MRRANRQIRRRSEAGYTLMLVVFMVATMYILATVATANIITEGKRQKEDELIWRGKQYARAIGLYYRRFNKFPSKVEDLTNQTNGVRFLRQAYKDPLNKEDGTWRFIYYQPPGMLIGSNRQTTLLQGGGVGLGTAGAPPLSGMLGQLQGGGSPSTPGFGAPGTQGTQGAQGTDGSSAGSGSSSGSQPQPLGGGMVGGNIIGVGSKVDKTALKVYLGESNYKNWEFIWNPFGQSVPGQQAPNVNGAPAPPGAANPAGAPQPAPAQ